MSKIICDICGTTYQDTAECCPICGCSRDTASELLGEDLLSEEIIEEPKGKGGRFAPRKKKEIFDYDEVNSDPEDEDDEEDEDSYDEEEEEEDAPRHNTIIVVLLTILIAGLLIAAGFIFVRYLLPNMKGEETIPVVTTEVVESTEESTEPTIPCVSMTMTSGAVAELNEEGQMFLLHVKAMPENTTDKIIYTSADESIATVTEDGKITAVSEGETTIYISCGKSSLKCDVVVKYVEETVPPTTEAAVEETIDVEEESADTTETTEAPAASINPDVVLKLKQTDFKLGVYYSKQLELDCDLEVTDVEWSSEHPHIATVDENGLVTAVKAGTTGIIAKYGDQEVQCIVRCG